jgi:uncharacterized protein
MILKEELEQISRLKRISLRNVEKDYLLELCMQTVSRYGDALVFKGGTALYKFHNLNRFSEDLDFTKNKKRFDLEELGNEILRDSTLLGISGTLAQNKTHANSQSIVISFRGPLFDGARQSMSRVVIDISSRERPETSLRSFHTPQYLEFPSFDMFVMGREEMLAEKVRALMTREKPRDAYDIWFLLKNRVKIDMNLVKRKLDVYGITYSWQEFKKALDSKERMWNTDLTDLIIGTLPEYDMISLDIEKALKDIR